MLVAALRRKLRAAMTTFFTRGTVILTWLFATSYGSGTSPYQYLCRRTYVELVCAYNASDGTFRSAVGVTGGFPLARTVNRTVRSVDPLASTEDLSEELNFTLRQESVLKSLTALKLADVATLSYLCQITKQDCSLTCILGSRKIIFSGNNAFALDGSMHDQMVSVCRRALDTSSFHSETFLGRWMNICETMHSIPTTDYGSLDFTYGDNSSLATCVFLSPLPVRFGLRIQTPDENVTTECRQRSDLNVSCSLDSDLENVTNPRAVRCCTFSRLTKHHCVILRKIVDAGPSIISLGEIERAIERSPVVMPIVLSVFVVIGASIVIVVVVLLRKRLGPHLSNGGRSRLRFAYRSATPRRRVEGVPPDLKRSD